MENPTFFEQTLVDIVYKTVLITYHHHQVIHFAACETVKALVYYHQLKDFAMHHGVDKTIKKLFKQFTKPTSRQLRGSRGPRAQGSLLAIFDALTNWDKIRDLVVEEFTAINPFRQGQPGLVFALLKWLKAITPLVHEDLPNLSGDRLSQTWRAMKDLWLTIGAEGGWDGRREWWW
ncbi:hypothetical protein FOXG_10997 [Fusarium oxysporum f. sp. lycopersici 4287]|uniref:Uncharacterized protein n=2 Tax=Fusarium oxysporum TaxID=5507 RepID=A0A0J9VII4_FUSO4|nr:hypothetical protein FOXG_10997 [Fusarium oxysporum f. sp. lycopersici 4287]KAJ9429677.1 hypothetical protein QL093DRAFT_2092863 [Fusarium oxysporum]KNB10893.1 hypothetical protein FOXG_10997 [Fusarium oxysporum f. sp. lycopersici 4287]